MMKHKSEVKSIFEAWKRQVENETGHRIKTLMSDNGGEYVSLEFEDYLKKQGIKARRTNVETPQENGIAERYNRTLMDTVRAMLAEAKCDKSLWAEAVKAANYIRNRCPTAALDGMVPQQAWSGRKPDVSHMRVFGSTVYVGIPKQQRRKLDDRAWKGILVGYAEGKSGYRVLNPETGQVHISRDVRMDEACRNEKD